MKSVCIVARTGLSYSPKISEVQLDNIGSIYVMVDARRPV
jgi:hypothetical protein